LRLMLPENHVVRMVTSMAQAHDNTEDTGMRRAINLLVRGTTRNTRHNRLFRTTTNQEKIT